MTILRQLMDGREISPLSYYFAEFITAQSDQGMDSLVALSAALVSEANQSGNVCIALDEFVDRVLFVSDRLPLSELPIGPDLEAWRAELDHNSLVGKPDELAPLILEDNRLYLHRYWQYETVVAKAILARLDDPLETDLGALDELFPDQADNSPNEQKIAVAIALRHRFSVISGGPGTGKTTTVLKLLAMLLLQNADLRIQLAAPTGKAASKLMESISKGLESAISASSIKDRIPLEASTIHRLLGYRKNGFRYSADYRLPIDCLVIDEASMIDLQLMYRLLDALPPQARIILLGDRDQLASVAAGNVLGDITGQGFDIRYSAEQTDYLEKHSLNSHVVGSDSKYHMPLADSVALLSKSYRFDSHSAIGQLAQQIKQGQTSQVVKLLSNREALLHWYPHDEHSIDRQWLDIALEHYHRVINANDIESAFTEFERFRVLCAVHSSIYGIDEINRRIEVALLKQSWAEQTDLFHGKAILIHRNDYESGLYNGDIGLLWQDDSNRLKVYFREIGQGYRSFPIAALPAYGPAWAMTIHKSQGSEFERVALILPDIASRPVLTRELFYTGVTRAKSALDIFASAATVEMACNQRSERHSGLATKLGWPKPSI